MFSYIIINDNYSDYFAVVNFKYFFSRMFITL